ncbi:MAG: phosphoglyceromutase [Rhodothermales bacterium]
MPSRLLLLVFTLLLMGGCSSPEEAVTTADSATALGDPVENVFLITLDGLRWEEVFTGADPWLLNNNDYTNNREEVASRFWRDTPEARREALMPFFWDVIADEGTLWGNRHLGSTGEVTNGEVFSYPGYNEILTGFADETIVSNDKVPNRNETVLEWVNGQPGFEGRVAAFGSWDVFPYIVNEERSGVPVNAGFDSAEGELTEKEAWLNELQAQTPSPWTAVRLDVFTHHYALETLKSDRPRLVYISYGETDDFAHDGDYRHYLDAAYRTDAFIRDLWTWVQNDPGYAGKTTFLITTDHGRGEQDRWVGHGADWKGSEAIWVAALGPGFPHVGEVGIAVSGEVPAPVYQNQMAATVAELLGLDYTNRLPIGGSLLD